ncbi:IS30 family transposase [Mycolicibacterium mucogenicum]|uniref:IS30 family transposase n=1 Tax=Mycolicibacterium mucogenicum TaxID=56689 RepID=UPI003977779F
MSHTTGNKWAADAGIAAVVKHRSVRYPREVREAFWAALRSGTTVLDAAVAVGVSQSAAAVWVQKAGWMPRTLAPAPELAAAPRRPRAPLTFIERYRLEELLEAGCTPGQAAKVLVRHPDTVGREMDRGMTRSGYRATVGQDAAQTNRKRPKTRKLEANPALLDEVVARLKRHDSPEQIAGRLRLDFPDDPEMWVSHETIYQALYVQPRGELARLVKQALRSGKTQRKPQGRSETGSGRGQIKDMLNISDRPKEADDRAIPGHWEGDLILGSTASGSAIGTLVERTTGFVVLLHLPGDRTAATLAAAMTTKVPEIPDILRRSLTWDQGKEMAKHADITKALGLPIYFCDPHSPWQRGTNENTNGLLRQYFPKGTDLSFYGPGWLDQVAAELNARPRKRHGWRTPAGELDRLLSDPSTFVAATA